MVIVLPFVYYSYHKCFLYISWVTFFSFFFSHNLLSPFLPQAWRGETASIIYRSCGPINADNSFWCSLTLWFFVILTCLEAHRSREKQQTQPCRWGVWRHRRRHRRRHRWWRHRWRTSRVHSRPARHTPPHPPPLSPLSHLSLDVWQSVIDGITWWHIRNIRNIMVQSIFCVRCSISWIWSEFVFIYRL